VETEANTSPASTASNIEEVLSQLTGIRAALVAAATIAHPRLAAVHTHYRDSARNLLHYLVLRRRDLRPLQYRLAPLGLSSLGRCASCTWLTRCRSDFSSRSDEPARVYSLARRACADAAGAAY
jgi:hypothetical protein